MNPKYLFIGLVLVFAGGVAASNITCDSCADCTAKLNGSYETVYLNTSLYNQNETCITFGASNVEFDCQGNTIDGDDNGTEYGIYTNLKENLTIKNCILTNWYAGIYLNSPFNNTLISNTASSNEYGIEVLGRYNNTLVNNTASLNRYGISLSDSRNNLLRNNLMENNSKNLYVTGFEESYFQDMDTTNMINGKPVYYYVNRQNVTIQSDAGFVSLISCRNITVSGIVLTNNSQGVLLVNTTDSKIINNSLRFNYFGIELHSSSNNTITNNNACGNLEYDIYDTDSNSGNNNTCDTTYNWNDTNDKGITGCTYTCSGLSKDIVPTEIGWSIASTPLSTTAETFLTETNCSLISKYEGGIQIHIKGSSFFNFNVTPGGGYYTYCQNTGDKTITGTPVESITIQLTPGGESIR